QEASKDEAKQAAAQKGNPLQRLIKLLGDIFIPILPAIVTAGLLMGINNLLTMKGLFGPKALIEMYPQIADISNIINATARVPLIFIHQPTDWTRVPVFARNPPAAIVLGPKLPPPTLVTPYALETEKNERWKKLGTVRKQ
ncbi:hypothetical protein PJX50_24715, partial [Escherichia coli]|nr:hypothetical protein [Escherichia coli]